jgi:hypothetical protein
LVSITKNALKYRKTPLLVPGIGPFSNANIYVLDLLIAEKIMDLKSSSFSLLDQVLGLIIKHKNKKLFAYENEPTPGPKSGVFR